MPFLTKIEQLNSADLTAYRPLILDGDPVGLIWRDNLARLRDHDLDLRDDGDRLVWHAPADFAARNAILADLAAALAREGYVSGWRNEQLPLLANLHRPVRALIERAAAPVIGVCGYGVHLNGTTMRDGVPHMWIARRAATKSVEPGKLVWAGIAVFGVAIIILNITSVKSFGALEFFLSSIKVISVIAFILVGLCLVFFGLPSHAAVGTANLVNDGGFMPHGFGAVWLSLAVVMFSFGGIEMISISAAEAKDPARSVRSSAKAMMIRLATFYVLALFIVVSIIPWRSAGELGEKVETSPFVLVFDQLGITGAAHFVNFVVLIAALSSANANLYAGARLMHSLATDRMAPRALAAVNASGVPSRAVWVSTSGVVIAILLALFSPQEAFLSMIFLIMVCALTVWVLILLAYIVYRRVEGKSSAFRLWGGRVTAGVGIMVLFAVWVALFMVRGSLIPAIVGVGYFLVLTIVYFARVKHTLTVDEDAFAEAQQASAEHATALEEEEEALRTASKFGR